MADLLDLLGLDLLGDALDDAAPLGLSYRDSE